MFMQRTQVWKRQAGFSLIELMIVVAIIGILAAAAVPNFINYRNKSRIAAGVGAAATIRAAMGSYAADSQGNSFPPVAGINSTATLTAVTNANGSSFGGTPGFTFAGYSTVVDSDGTTSSYSLTFTVVGVPNTMSGSMIQVTDQGITKLTY